MEPGGYALKKTTKIIQWAAAALVLAAAVLAGIRFLQHEKDQNEAIRELKEQVITLQEEKQASDREGSGEKLSALEDRITRLEIRAETAAADYTYFAIGNSITVHAPNEVWWNETGMAASETDRDFVHLVAASCGGTQGKTAVFPLYFYAWETEAENRSSCLAMLDPYLEANPQLVTIQLGENAEDLTSFEEDFEALIRYVQAGAPDARILVIDDFWTNEERGRMKREAAEKTGAEFIALDGIRDNPEYQAGTGAVVYDPEGNPHTVENPDVASHPGDKGMQAIADRIAEALKQEP